MGLGIFNIISIGLSIASAAYQQKLAREAERRRQAALDKARGQKFNITSEAAPLPVIYGKQIAGGTKTGHKVKNNYTASGSTDYDTAFEKAFSNTTQPGSKKEFLAVQTALCHGGIEGVQHIKVNGIDYRGATSDMKNNKSTYRHRFHTHNSGGGDSASVSMGFPITNTFTDTAWVASFFKLNRETPQYSGSPEVEYILKGRKIRKINSSNFTLNTSYEYSNNPAYCLLDYLLNSDFGRGLSSSDIDLESFYNSSVICDTIKLSNATLGGSVNGAKPIFSFSTNDAFPGVNDFSTGNFSTADASDADYLYFAEDISQLYSLAVASNGTPTYTTISTPNSEIIRLYECNITLDTTETLRDNIERILATMGIASLTWTPEGKYKLSLEYPADEAGVVSLVNSNHSFTEDDIIRNEATVVWPTAQERFTQVTVQFPNEAENFDMDSVTWPPTSSLSTTPYAIFLAEDNNNPLTKSFSPEGITNKYNAQAYAEQQVRKSRGIFTVDLTLSRKALTVEPGDIIHIKSDNLGLIQNKGTVNETGYNFKVESVAINDDFSVKVKCYHFHSGFLAWNVLDDTAYSILPEIDFSVAAPVGLTFTASGNQLYGTSAGKLTWTASDDISAKDYVIEAKLSTENDDQYQQIGSTVNTTFDILGMKTATYIFSVRARNINNRLSDRVTLQQSLQLITNGSVEIIYANTANASTNTQSYTFSTQEFVAYYSHTGSQPTLPIRTGITFTRFVGADGTSGNSTFPIYADSASGTNQSFSAVGKTHVNFYSSASSPSLPVSGLTFVPLGTAGTRGPGWWRYVDSTNASAYYTTGASLQQQTRINAAFTSATSLTVTESDRFIIKCTDIAIAYIYNGATWIAQADFIDGDLMVTGTVTSDKLDVTNLSTVTANMGTLTAGKLESPDGKFKIDLTNKEILITV